jgi:hypothetical protein
VAGKFGYLVENLDRLLPVTPIQADADETERGTGLRTIATPDRVIITLGVVVPV